MVSSIFTETIHSVMSLKIIYVYGEKQEYLLIKQIGDNYLAKAHGLKVSFIWYSILCTNYYYIIEIYGGNLT